MFVASTQTDRGSSLQSSSESSERENAFASQSSQLSPSEANESPSVKKDGSTSGDLLNSSAIFTAQRPGALFVLEYKSNPQAGIQSLGNKLLNCFDSQDLGQVNSLTDQAKSVGFITSTQENDIRYFFSLQFSQINLDIHSKDLGITVPDDGRPYENMTQSDVNNAVQKGYINQQEANDLLKFGTVSNPIVPSGN